jgi:hypothetical protein
MSAPRPDSRRMDVSEDKWLEYARRPNKHSLRVTLAGIEATEVRSVLARVGLHDAILGRDEFGRPCATVERELGSWGDRDVEPILAIAERVGAAPGLDLDYVRMERGTVQHYARLALLLWERGWHVPVWYSRDAEPPPYVPPDCLQMPDAETKQRRSTRRRRCYGLLATPNSRAWTMGPGGTCGMRSAWPRGLTPGGRRV